MLARFSVVIGLLLCGLTVYGMVGSTSGKIATAFVPMVFGIPLVICGVVALNPHRRRLWMAMAAMIGALGMMGAGARASVLLGDIVQGESTNGLALRVVVWMSVLCATFVVIYVVTAAQKLRRQPQVPGPRPPSERPADSQCATSAHRSGESGPAVDTAVAGNDPQPQSSQPADSVRVEGREPSRTAASPEPKQSEPPRPAVPAGSYVDKRSQLHRI